MIDSCTWKQMNKLRLIKCTDGATVCGIEYRGQSGARSRYCLPVRSRNWELGSGSDRHLHGHQDCTPSCPIRPGDYPLSQSISLSLFPFYLDCHTCIFTLCTKHSLGSLVMGSHLRLGYLGFVSNRTKFKIWRVVELSILFCFHKLFIKG